MLKFCSLSSGSSGNSYYISSETTAILVDAGISCARIQKSLAHIGEDIASVRAVFLTHEHSDHTSGLATLLKKHEIALYSTDGTRSELSFLSGVAVRCEPRIFESGASVRIGDIVVHSYPISHDARDPVCYKIESDCGAIVGIITDLGWADTEVIKAFYDCDLLLLESNHDVELLKIGPYPAFLKSRIIGKSGHLSNDDAGIIARNIIAQGRLRYLVLGHLSETNNHPDLARATVEQSVRERGFVSGEDYELDVMRRGQLGKMYLLRRTLILLMCALISVLNLVLMPMLNPPAFAEIRSDELLLREQVQYDIPVLSVAVVQGGERKLFFSRQLSEGALRDYDAPFQAGSMARVTTSLALLRLLEQRGITMEEPIRVHLPAELSKSLGEALDGVRFADLFLHTTGFTNNRYNTISEKPYSEDIRSRAQSYILRSEKKLPTGEYSVQSNSDFAFMCLLIEEFSGKSFAAAMQDFFAVVGMKNSSVGDASAQELTRRYMYDSGLLTAAPNYYAYLPAADDFVTTLEDMEKLCAFLTAGDFAQKNKVFTKVFTNINEQTARSTVFNYVELDGAGVFMLDAALPGAYERLVFIPEKKLGFFVYYNVGRVEARDEITSALIDGLAPGLGGGAAEKRDYIMPESAARLVGYYSPVNVSSRNLESAIRLTHQLRINKVADGLLIGDDYFRAVSETLFYCEQSGSYALFELDERGALKYMVLEGELYSRAFSANLQLSLVAALAICALAQLLFVIRRWGELLAGRVDDRPRVWLLFAQLLFLACIALTFMALRGAGYWMVAYGGGLAYGALRYLGWASVIAVALPVFVMLYTRGDYKWRGYIRVLVWLSLPLGCFFVYFLVAHGFVWLGIS